MSNFQSINDEEIEQDSLVADVNTINSNIVVINNKMNLTAGSNMKTALDANTAKTSFPGFGSSEGTALQGNTTTISSAQATAINSNSQKTSFPGFGTSGGTALEGNTSLLALGTSSSTALAGNTALLQLGTSSSTALAGDTITISSAQSNAISANSSKVSMTLGTSSSTALAGNTALLQLGTSSSTALAGNTTTISTTQANNISTNNAKVGITTSQISAISSNTSGVSALVLAYPRHTIIRHYNYTTADIYNDGTVKFNWDGTNKQLRFWILSIGTNEYMVGGVKIWKGTTEIRKSIYVSQNVSTAYKYFTDPQVSPSSSIIDNTYDLKTSYGTAEYFLCPYFENDYPTYEIKILIGYYLGWHTIHIKRFT